MRSLEAMGYKQDTDAITYYMKYFLANWRNIYVYAYQLLTLIVDAHTHTYIMH